MSPDHRILALAAQQHALFTYRQAREAGLSDRMIEGRLRLGVWERWHRGALSTGRSTSRFPDG